MYLIIQQINNKLFNQALLFFDKNYIEKLKEKSTFKESLVARYLIENSPEYNKNDFYSISHKTNLVFIWINDKKIWVDIEIFKNRDKSLLNSFTINEYDVIWWKNFENFYFIWTAKESIIKYEWLILDNMKNIILKKSKDSDKKISDINFSKKLTFEYDKKQYIVYSWKIEDKIFSIIYY